MVSTRNHPKQFPPPAPTPSTRSPSKGARSVSPPDSPTLAVATKRTTRNSGGAGGEVNGSATPRAASSSSSSSSAAAAGAWSHTPSQLALVWLLVSVPLVIWDATYVFLRPHSMPGGKWHAPWKPYALYGTVDLVYGFPTFEANDGFNYAQSLLNVIESGMYIFYLYTMFAHGEEAKVKGRGAPSGLGKLSRGRRLAGRKAAIALVVGFAAVAMTTAKTILYWSNEHFSGWKHTRHNDMATFIVVFVLPNAPWIIIPGYLSYVMGAEIVQGLEAASSGKSTRSKKSH